jgi:hypothetical protein
MGGEWHLTKNFFYYLNKDADKFDIRVTFFFDGTMPIHYNSFELTNKHKSPTTVYEPDNNEMIQNGLKRLKNSFLSIQ